MRLIRFRPHGIAAALLLAAGSGLPAQTPRFAIAAWGTEQGLPSNVARGINQTPDGYLWLASYEGLVRFDGVAFRAYTEAEIPGLSRASFRRVAVDRAGTLWAGSETGGLVRRGADGRWNVLTTRQGLHSDRVTALLADDDGSLWVGTRAGLNRVVAGRVVAIPGPAGMPQPAITALARAGDGTLWIGTIADGLLAYRDGRFRRVGRAQGLDDDRVTALRTDGEGTVWVGTFSGLNRLSDGVPSRPLSLAGLDPGPIHELLPEDEHSWWIAADNGLFHIEDSQAHPVLLPDGRAFTQVEGLHQDREGNLWVGSRSGGLYRVRRASVRMLGVADGLPHEFVSAVSGDGAGGLWIGTRMGLLHRGAAGTQRFTQENGALRENVVRDVVRDRAGDVWVATNNGLTRIRGAAATTFTIREGLPDDRVRTLLEDRSGGMWIGTYNGLARQTGDAIVRFGAAQGLADGYILSLFQDRRGVLWVGTQSAGLLRWTGERFVPGPPELSGQPVFRISEDADGTLWVGTTRGLARVRGQRVTRFAAAQGLPGNTVFQALDDGRGYLWLTAPWGIARVSRASLERVGSGAERVLEVKEFGLSDGLPAREATSIGRPWRDAEGTLAIPTPAGVALIDPRRLPRNPVAPQTHLERVVAEDAVFEPGEPIDLPPGRDRVEFHFTAPSFVAPAQLRFRYRLAGFDRGWMEGGTRRAAYYTNLPPGHYTFQVQARNEDGVWSSRPAAATLTLRPYFWETWWFMGLAVAMLATLAYGVHRLRVGVAERATREEVLRTLSLRDELTGLYNRRGLAALAEQQMEGARRLGVGFDLLFIDLDRMKDINDTYGHAHGDRALVDAAALLRATFRRSDVLARLGGDEFAVLIIARDPEGSWNEAEAATARLHRAVERHNTSLRRPYRLSLSVGAARFDPADPLPLDELLATADREMYANKRVKTVLRA